MTWCELKKYDTNTYQDLQERIIYIYIYIEREREREREYITFFGERITNIE